MNISPVPHGAIVVGIDGSSHSAAAAERAFWIAELRQAPLTAVITWNVEVVDGKVVTTPDTEAWNAVEAKYRAVADRIVDPLRAGCRARLDELHAAIVEEHFVPGAFELPLAAQWLAETGRFDAVICLGCVVRGDTPHFDFVAGECARGVREVGLKTDVPVIFGVLTTNTEAQAFARADSPRRAEETPIKWQPPFARFTSPKEQHSPQRHLSSQG